MKVEGWLTLVLALQGLLAADAATAAPVPVHTNQARGMADAGNCHVIHVYLDVSGSMFDKLPGRESTAYSAALYRLETTIAPQVDRLKAEVKIYRFGAAVNAPEVFVSSAKLREHIAAMQRSRQPQESATDLTKVWSDILAKSQIGSRGQAFIIFSDFAHSAAAGDSTGRSSGVGRTTDTADSLHDWQAFVERYAAEIRRVIETSVVRLVRLPTLEEHKLQQDAVLNYLAIMSYRLNGRIIHVDQDEDWEGFRAQLAPVRLRLANKRLELVNEACVPIRVTTLRVHTAQGAEHTEERPAESLDERGGRTDWKLPERMGLIGVLGAVNGGPTELVSEELATDLSPNDVIVQAILFGDSLQVFIVPQVFVGDAVDASATVLVHDRSGARESLKQPIRIPANAVRHVAPLRGDLSSADVAAIRETRRIGLRLDRDPGTSLYVEDVPVKVVARRMLKVGRFSLVVVAVACVVLLIGTWARGWRQWWHLMFGVLDVVGVLGLGTVPIDADVWWMRGAFVCIACAVGAWVGWCVFAMLLPAERRTLGKIVAMIDAGTYKERLLVRSPYRRVRWVGGGACVVAALAVWWLFETTYTDLAAQRWPLDLLNTLVDDASSAKN